MKYRVIYDGEEYTVLLEDGGVACFRYYDGKAACEYYQERITTETNSGQVWENLGEGKMYYDEFPEDVNPSKLLRHCRDWLCPGGEDWEYDEDLFINIFPKTTVFNGKVVTRINSENYRGMAGWRVYYTEENIATSFAAKGKIISTNQGKLMLENGSQIQCLRKGIDVYKFNEKKIPKGELCWFSNNGTSFFLSQFDNLYRKSKNVNRYGSTTCIPGLGRADFKYCVPMIIAANNVQALMYRDWDKE